MTANDTFGRTLSAWLHEDAEHHLPDHLAEVLEQTVATRQRPAWSSLERWLPMDTTFRPRLIVVPHPGRLLLLAALIVLMVVMAIVAVGSRQSSLPEPFGLARNGSLATSRDGDLYLIDPATVESRLVSVGEGFDFSPTFSRDGTKMTFLRSDGPLTEPAVLTLYVADADGSDARAVTPPTKSLDWFDWSPDGTRIAYMAEQILWVVDIRGGEPIQIKETGPAHFPTWLPPDGKELIFRLETRSPGIFAIAPDGTGKRRPLSTAPANNEFDYQSIAVSPDGSHVTFTRWFSHGPDGRPYPSSLGWLPRVYVLDIATGTEVALPTPAGTGQSGPAVYSPDGALVAYARVYREGAFQIVVANADGSGNERTIGPRKPGPTDGTDVAAWWNFTPDGTALLVRYGNDEWGTTQMLPLDGSPATDLGTGGMDFIDMQRLRP